MKRSNSFIPYSIYLGKFQILDRGKLTAVKIKNFFLSIYDIVGEKKHKNSLAFLDEWPAGKDIIFYFSQGFVSPTLNINIRIDRNLMAIYVVSLNKFSPKEIVSVIKEKLFDVSIGEQVSTTIGSERREEN